ncbi:MAG TPA: hypothetical protein VIQ22_06530 [Gammaproteobacteria bacterium]
MCTPLSLYCPPYPYSNNLYVLCAFAYKDVGEEREQGLEALR